MPPMHQVNRSRMPLFRTLTGCKWRKTLVRTARPRLRAVSGGPCRKIEFQIWVLRVYSQSLFSIAILLLRRAGGTPAPPRPSGLQERLGVAPLALLVQEAPGLVDQDLPVVGQDDPVPLQRPRRRPL